MSNSNEFSDVEAPAWPAIGIVAAVGVLAASFGASRYFLFGDELYFLAAGAHPSVSYADQGPILPLLARGTAALGGGDDAQLLFRLPVVVMFAGAVVAAGLLAREMGGGHWAQCLAATAYATSPLLLIQSDTLSTNAVDAPMWVLISWCVVRWVRTREDMLLLAAAALTAIDLQVKWLIPAFWVGVAVGVAICGPRDLLRRPALWVGGGLVAVSMVPAVMWQADHGWPQVALTRVVANEQSYSGGRWTFIPILLVFAGLLGSILLACGLWGLFRSPRLRPFRFLAITFIVVVAAFLAVDGRPYYPAGMLTVVFAAGATELTRWAQSRRWVIGATLVACVASTGIATMALPWSARPNVAPTSDISIAASKIAIYGELGWPQLAADVAGAVGTLAPTQRATSAIVTGSYWQAAALRYYGRGLPPVYSFSRGYAYLGTPPDSATTVIWIQYIDDAPPRKYCADLTRLKDITGRLGFPSGSTETTLWRCNPREPWSMLWPRLTSM